MTHRWNECPDRTFNTTPNGATVVYSQCQWTAMNGTQKTYYDTGTQELACTANNCDVVDLPTKENRNV